MRSPAALATALLLAMLILPVSVSAGEGAPAGEPQQTAVDRWHSLRHYYSMDENPPDEHGVRFGLLPGVGVRAGSPGTLFGVADLYISMTRPRSFSLFAGAGIEAKSSVRSAVFTLGWGGVRRIHVARHQTGFFGAFLRYRNYVGETGATRRDAISAGTEVAAGHMGFTFELGASRRDTGDWKFLIYAGYKFVWAVPLGW